MELDYLKAWTGCQQNFQRRQVDIIIPPYSITPMKCITQHELKMYYFCDSFLDYKLYTINLLG